MSDDSKIVNVKDKPVHYYSVVE